ncbi:MAG TPA: hypothetical protein VK639_12250 [Terriglobales bacterium]|nr:hypothetical protein [Terriglobales bacterium]
MSTEIPIEELLRWRAARAEAEAPPAPRAARLLEMARPWWETWPERFQSFVERLGKIRVAYGHAMAEPRQSHCGHPVPALVVRAVDELETSVRVLYLNVRDGRLRLRFQLDAATVQAQGSFEVTFVSDKPERPLLSAPAICALDGEYRIDTELSEELAYGWEQLKVTDRMPFRLILRSDKDGG